MQWKSKYILAYRTLNKSNKVKLYQFKILRQKSAIKNRKKKHFISIQIIIQNSR